MNAIIADTGPVNLLVELRTVRNRLDASTDLIAEALDIRELLTMGILDADQARDLVKDFKRRCAVQRWRIRNAHKS